jgi:hypothetical protein
LTISFAPAEVDKATVVDEVEPKTLFVVDGKVKVKFPPVPCVTTNVPYAPAVGVEVKLKVLFWANVTLAFKPKAGFQFIELPAVKTCGVEA